MVSRDSRAVWLNLVLSRHGVADYGRASAIAKKLTVSNAVVQGWLGGSLSKDLEVALRFATEYGFTIEEWVTLEAKPPVSDDSWKEHVLKAKQFEDDHGALSAKQFMFILELIANDSEIYKNNKKLLAEVIGNNPDKPIGEQ